MIFSPEAIALKNDRLDSIHAIPELVNEVVSTHLQEPFELIRLKRYWEPGGGASLFLLSTREKRYFLKVKHISIFVESRLESENDFNRLPSLKNEAHFLSILDSQKIPAVLFYEERDEHTFLALEYLESFEQAVTGMSAGQLVHAWDDLESFVRKLHALGIVHTDLHEGNLCFRNKEIVVCDFEEARFLKQDIPFESSLDYCGCNRYGNVGDFPEETGRGIGGLTCLVRMREVFNRIVRERLRSHLEECNFDQSCPFNCDTLQEEDSRIYQSLDLAGLSIAGQRPMRDIRKNVLSYFLFRQWQKQKRLLRYLDIGSNLGAFCFLGASYPFVGESTGLEAFKRYVEAAEALRFLADAKKVRFRQFVCGETRFDEIGFEGIDVCTILSVYHHISSRDAFLNDLARYRPGLILAEFATQDRYYSERGSVAPEIDHIRQRLGYRHAVILMRSPDYQRPMVLFTDDPPTAIDRLFMCLAKTRLFALLFSLLRAFGYLRGKASSAVYEGGV